MNNKQSDTLAVFRIRLMLFPVRIGARDAIDAIGHRTAVRGQKIIHISDAIPHRCCAEFDHVFEIRIQFLLNADKMLTIFQSHQYTCKRSV